MGRKTISLTEDAYERLEAERRENESFDDVVRRLTADANLREHYGARNEDTADEIETVVERRREKRTASRRDRIERLAETFDG